MKKNFIYLFLATTALFSACSTDLDVIGDYEETMVVYGLLDQSQSKQYIKINKAFLGEGNAFGYAQVQDSVQFVNSLNVRLKRLSDGTEYVLSPDNTIPKEDGTFYAANQANAIYSYTSTGPTALNAGSEYELIIRNGDTGNEVTAKTKLIQDFSFTKPNASTGAFGFVSTVSPNTLFSVEWNSSKNGKLYQLVVRFNYTEYIGTDTTVKYLDWVFAPQKTQHLTGGELIANNFRGKEFMQYIGNSLSPLSGSDKRVAGNVELRVIAGGEDLSTFIDVNRPSTGIIQDRPEYTNINNGLGIFSARYNKAPFSRPMSTTTIDSLACGQYTKQLNFANTLGVAGACPP
ncbi:MAG: DUF4249 family protein [Bacteroidota bacterium]|nr:DUF4249 family protein [Bacteroidota bacterium]